ncbi:hypothetical protein [Pseudomonas sp. BIGb0164]|uniref:hypothetical protein n=1 Tax=Pseudomonas sp. BIGb0164 TaxID=2940605 RepID=UPI002166F0C5|nr:hypothetical protein [Pseudomonas sp. BIGb0164]MCS4249486.1 hypothetical protein [Pseudomonas sp. BIGb0164]
MDGYELLQLIVIGVIAGAFGQGLRTIVGLKKASDEAAAEGTTLRSEGLDVSRLIFSLFIGAIAGGIGILTITGFQASAAVNISAEMFFGVVGIGYAGTDFIEGFVRTQLPKWGEATICPDHESALPSFYYRVLHHHLKHRPNQAKLREAFENP